MTPAKSREKMFLALTGPPPPHLATFGPLVFQNIGICLKLVSEVPRSSHNRLDPEEISVETLDLWR